jgi:hypothetical protein
MVVFNGNLLKMIFLPFLHFVGIEDPIIAGVSLSNNVTCSQQ